MNTQSGLFCRRWDSPAVYWNKSKGLYEKLWRLWWGDPEVGSWVFCWLKELLLFLLHTHLFMWQLFTISLNERVTYLVPHHRISRWQEFWELLEIISLEIHIKWKCCQLLDKLHFYKFTIIKLYRCNKVFVLYTYMFQQCIWTGHILQLWYYQTNLVCNLLINDTATPATLNSIVIICL